MRSDIMDTRAGVYVQQSTGYRAFIPASLPPEPRFRSIRKCKGFCRMQIVLSAGSTAQSKLFRTQIYLYSCM